MSGRHSGRTSQGLRITALPRTLKLLFRLAPRQLNDEIALAKVEIKRKGIQLGVAAAFFAVALVFVAFLVVGLIVAAIMGLATIMPAWLAALLVCAAFLLIALVGGLMGRPEIQEGHAAGSGGDHPGDQARSRHRQGRLGLQRRPPRSGQPRGEGRQGRQGTKLLRRPKRRRKPRPRRTRRNSRTRPSPSFTAAWTSAGATSPRSATNWTPNSTSSPRSGSCWAPPRKSCGRARPLLNHGRDVASAEDSRPVRSHRAGPALRWKPLAAFAGAAAVFVVLLRRLLRNP